MSQPVKKSRGDITITKKKTVKRRHKEYGTSKLEERFAKEFLDKLGVKYIYQFKAEDIGRYYDFKIENGPLIEVDGSFYHGYGLKHEEKNPMQKHNEYVDELKDRWALEHGIPIIRIWEHDINKNPSKVMKILEENIGKCREKFILKENKKKRH